MRKKRGFSPDGLKKFIEEIDGEKIDLSINAYLKDERELIGLTQAQLGQKMGKSKQYISDIENKRRTLTFDTLLAWVEATESSKFIFVEKFYQHTLERAGIKDKFVKLLTKEQIERLEL